MAERSRPIRARQIRARQIRALCALALPLLLGGCAGLQLGDAQTLCEAEPARCRPASEALGAEPGIRAVRPAPAADPALAPPRTDALALHSGMALRIWIAPHVDAQGILHGSRYSFVTLQSPQTGWEIGQNALYWTGPPQAPPPP